MKRLWFMVRVFFKMLGRYDGNGYFIGVRDAFWYAKHLEWWGL